MTPNMTNIIRRTLSIAALLTLLGGAFVLPARAQEPDSVVFARLTSIDPELLQYFPRWYVCEPDLQAKIYNAFRVLGYRKAGLDQQQIRVTAQPVSEAEATTYDILIVECGTERMTAQDLEANIPRIYSKLADKNRPYCYSEIPSSIPATRPQAEAIINFMHPTNVNHSFTLSAFEQTLKIGNSGFWLSNTMGTDQVGYHFWNAGEAKVTLQRPLYVNDDASTRRAIPYLMNAKLGFGYRLSSNPNDGQLLDFIPGRRLDAGYGGKFVGALDFHMPFHPEFGLGVNMELPLRAVQASQSVDATTYVLNDIGSRRITAPTYDSDPIATVNLLRSTGQVTMFYNWWVDKDHPENFFRLDLGLNYYEIREVGMFRDSSDSFNYLGIDGVRGLNTWKPNELGDWIYAKLEYRNQSTFPFGASLQYSNQILLAHAYIPLLGQWLYIEGKYATPLRGLRPFEREHVFMISPVLRLNF